MLLHTVLAVVYGGLLVSARPDWGHVRDGEEAELIGNADPYTLNEVVEDDAQHNWAPDAPQLIVESAQVPYYAVKEDVERPESDPWDGDLQRPRVTVPFPNPPEDLPDFPPDIPPKLPHFPPHEPSHPGPPGFPHEPHHPGHPCPQQPPGAPERVTIYQYLERQPKFSRIFKLVNHSEEVTKLLNDSSVNVTFFALPNWGFPHRRHHDPHPPDEEIDFEEAFASGDDIGDTLAVAESLLNTNSAPDEDKVKAFVKFVLLYQTLPTRLPSVELAKNLTYPTSLTLTDGSLDGESLRIRVGKAVGPFPFLAVNLFSSIIRPDIAATNGLIHVVNKPVLPPPSAFQVAFLLPDVFSTFTSALQRVGLTDAVEWRNVEGGTVDGSPAVTLFAPTNRAFQRLPRKLRLFLFSPFGEKALKKLLQYHIVPEFVLHTNYLYNASDSDLNLAECDSEDGEFYGQLNYNYDAFNLSGLDGDKPATLKYEAYESPRGKTASGQSIKFGRGRIPGWQPVCTKKDQAYPEDPACSHGDPQNMRYDDRRQSYCGARDPWLSYRRPDYPSYYSYDGLHHPPPPPSYERGCPCHSPSNPPPPYHPHAPPHYGPPPPPPFHWENPHHGHPPFFHHGSPPHCHGPVPPPPPFEHHHGPHGWCFHPPPFPPHYEGHPHCERPSPDGPTQPRLPRHEGPIHFPPPPYPWPVPGHGPFPPHEPHPAPCAPPRRPHFPFPPRPSIAYSLNVTAPTLLANHSLDVHVIQLVHKSPVPVKTHAHYETILFVHGVKVGLPDVPLRNGAIHVIDRLLNPLKKSHGPPHHTPPPHHPHHPHHPPEGERPEEGSFVFEEKDEPVEDQWAGWQEWLPRWAEEE